MIPGSTATLDSANKACEESSTCWQEELASSIRDPQQLLGLLGLDKSLLAQVKEASNDFPLRVPHPYLNRIRKGDINDPLLRQVLPLGDELVASPGYSHDPLLENAVNPAPGLIHKYQGRALLIVSPNCAVNCRYCFRRHFPYQGNSPGLSQWKPALDYVAGDSSISEVIYSGGDPLAVSDRKLQWLTAQIAAIPHVKRLRVHTRLPVVIPSRITSQCLDWLTGTNLQTVLVIHSNHANELDHEVGDALSKLREKGVTLLNQTVLLRGVNDNTNALTELSEKLFDLGVLPYYLHLLDKVSGAAHFDIPESRAIELRDEMMAKLPGYLVPKLVAEVPGHPNKTPIG